MQNNYINIPTEDNENNANLVLQKDGSLWIKQCLLAISALSTFIGGLMFIDLTEKQQYQPECKRTQMLLMYYTDYLLIDGSAQLLISFIIICVLSCFKNFKLKKEIDRQLVFQVVDTTVLLFVLLIIEVYLKQQRSCITIQVNIFLVLYSFWIYLLLFILALVRFNS